VEQIQLKILSGEYEPGGRLPSIRDLAAETSVNPNTVQRAFSELEQGGLVYSQRTSGRFITDDTEKIAEVRRKYAEKTVLEFIDEMRNLEYSTHETIELISAIIKEEMQ